MSKTRINKKRKNSTNTSYSSSSSSPASISTSDLTKEEIKALLAKRIELHNKINALNKQLAGTLTTVLQLRFEKEVQEKTDELNKTLKMLNIDNKHEWILDVVEETKLPYLGLPVKWKQTSEEHCKIIFDPTTNKTYNLKTEVEKKLKSTPIGFITSTANINPMPGANAPAAARYSRYDELVRKGAIVTNAHGEAYSICPTHGDFVKVENYQSDHMQSINNIETKQIELVNLLNQNKQLAKTVMSVRGWKNSLLRQSSLMMILRNIMVQYYTMSYIIMILKTCG